MNLKDEIRKLAHLQEIDSRIYNQKEKKDIKKPAELEKLKIDLDKKKESFSIFEEKIKKVQLKKKEEEIELASKEEQLKKSQAQLYQLKTNKEYQAKLTEIGSLKADVSNVEEDVIKILEELEEAKKEFDLEKKSLEQEEKKFKEEEGKTKDEIKAIEAQIKNLEDKRNSFINEIDEKIFFKYLQLLQSRQGLAIIPVKNNHCGFCQMLTTHQKINEIKMYKDLTLCENCVRILYIPEDIE